MHANECTTWLSEPLGVDSVTRVVGFIWNSMGYEEE